MGGRTVGAARERMTGAVEAGILAARPVSEISRIMLTRIRQDDIS